MKKCEIQIRYCNSSCPYFYHKFSDNENMYCDKLKKKIFDDDGGDCTFDAKPRPIPNECPLEDI